MRKFRLDAEEIGVLEIKHKMPFAHLICEFFFSGVKEFFDN